MTVTSGAARLADMNASELLELSAEYTSLAIDHAVANSEHGAQMSQSYSLIAQNLIAVAHARITAGLPHRSC
jgi:hypothetical protein